MGNDAILLDTPPDIEVFEGIIYVVFDGKRHFAYKPNIARIANERMRKALDEFDRQNSGKVVGFT